MQKVHRWSHPRWMGTQADTMGPAALLQSLVVLVHREVEDREALRPRPGDGRTRDEGTRGGPGIHRDP